MPAHDWTSVDAGIFHDFQLAWVVHLSEMLKDGRLPKGVYALIERHAGASVADLQTLRDPVVPTAVLDIPGAIPVATIPPRVRRRLVASPEAFYRNARRSLAIRHVSGHRLVALLEIVSPGNKNRPKSVEEFVGKVQSAMAAGVHVLVVDLFPPGRHDPSGLHGAIWAHFGDPAEVIEPGLPLTLASFVAAEGRRLPEAYIEAIAVGSPIPEMPLFLETDSYVNVPLGPSYEAAVRGLPGFWREVLEGPRGGADRA